MPTKGVASVIDDIQSKCACVSIGARECMASRYPVPFGLGDDEDPSDAEEECECACHRELDEYFGEEE